MNRRRALTSLDLIYRRRDCIFTLTFASGLKLVGWRFGANVSEGGLAR